MNPDRQRIMISTVSEVGPVRHTVEEPEGLTEWLANDDRMREEMAVATALSICAIETLDIYRLASSGIIKSSNQNWNIQDELDSLHAGLGLLIGPDRVRTAVSLGAQQFFNEMPEDKRSMEMMRWAYPELF